MNPQAVQRKTQRQPPRYSRVRLSGGYSPRPFRRIIEEDHIPVMQIGQKHFVTVTDLETVTHLDA